MLDQGGAGTGDRRRHRFLHANRQWNTPRRRPSRRSSTTRILVGSRHNTRKRTLVRTGRKTNRTRIGRPPINIRPTGIVRRRRR